MTAATTDPERYLAEILDELTGVATLDAAVLIAARAASELADADGLFLVSAESERCVVGLAEREQTCLCDLRNSALYRDPARRILWDKEDAITLPDGVQRRIGVALTVPLQPVGGYAAVVFFWQPGGSADPQAARKLELLGKALGMSACGRKKAEEHLALQRDQQRISAGLQHRLRNNLAQMRSIIRRSHETAESAEHFALHLEARVAALTRMQGALYAVGEAGVELEDIVRAELTAGAAPEQRCLVQGPAIRLHAKGTEMVGLAVHELATNSMKFGALGTASGLLAITWTVSAEPLPHLRLRWMESGVTIVTTAPRRRGFGHELVECTLPYELGARTRITFSPGGVVCDVEVPLETCVTDVEQATKQAVQGASR